MTRDEFKEIIIEIIRSELLLPESVPIKGNSDFTRDLKLDSDDLTFIFIPEVENRFGVFFSNETWATIGTIDELINVLQG